MAVFVLKFMLEELFFSCNFPYRMFLLEHSPERIEWGYTGNGWFLMAQIIESNKKGRKTTKTNMDSFSKLYSDVVDLMRSHICEIIVRETRTASQTHADHDARRGMMKSLLKWKAFFEWEIFSQFASAHSWCCCVVAFADENDACFFLMLVNNCVTHTMHVVKLFIEMRISCDSYIWYVVEINIAAETKCAIFHCISHQIQNNCE